MGVGGVRIIICVTVRAIIEYKEINNLDCYVNDLDKCIDNTLKNLLLNN